MVGTIPSDKWESFSQVLAKNGDDCDGLSTVALHLLRSFGFSDTELYYGVIYRSKDGAHHSVLFWFQVRTDPIVIDPTGAASVTPKPMSEIVDWVPLLHFNQNEIYVVKKDITLL